MFSTTLHPDMPWLGKELAVLGLQSPNQLWRQHAIHVDPRLRSVISTDSCPGHKLFTPAGLTI